MRTLVLAVALLGAASTLGAQQSDPDKQVTGGGQLPAGWHARLDRPNAKMEDLKFITMGKGLHATSGPAAIYWNAADHAKGSYTVQATFTQTKAPMHPEAYGLFVGGQSLDSPNQSYLYYVVRGDGKYLLKHRAGSDVHTITDWTESPALKKQDADGKATNTLAIDVTPTEVRFLANGTQVASLPKSNPMAATDGQAGIRVNHNLDVHIEGFKVVKK
ncbi:MAG TPA: hypothetical protein VFS05_06980 [Gemmatimonadaceae bacterium]|nr:hypothetical protein [Gemmatimonadaceae bacterium]